MAVVGIDFGTLASKIGVARHRGIDIIANEVSNRATPSLVAFGPKQRQIGESAKTQETSNFKNTIGSLKRLVGRTLIDPDVQEVEKKFINAKLVDVSGTVGVDVNFRGERTTFTATQLVGMYLGKLRDTAAKELKTGVTDVVIAVPLWFTDVQRRAVLDAASIAGLNVLRLINDTTATALGYGITKSDLPEEESPRHVVFVDVGHSDLTVSVVAFWKGNLQVKASAFDRHLGGRDIDYALVQHFSEEFKTKYRIDVLSNPKATFRLLAGCEKLKKVLSANNEAPLNVESIMNDVDASSKLTREEYETLIGPLLEKIAAPIQQALADSGLSVEEIDAVELIGGSTRVPAVRAKISSVFPGKVLSTTLNQDEAVARGATFSCAMLSPVFRVRDFHITDIAAFPVKVQWDFQPGEGEEGEDTELVVFPKGNNMPSTKVLTFYRKEGKPFEVQVMYAEPNGLPGAINPWIGRFVAKDVPRPAGTPEGDLVCVRVKTRLNNHGVVSVEQAYVEEVEEKEEPVPAPAPMDVDGAATPAAEGAEAAPPPPPPKKKRITRKRDIPFLFSHSSLDSSLLLTLRETENSIHASDKLVMDTEDRKNALEEYVYDMRGKLDERYVGYAKPEEKSKLLEMLKVEEEWLYSEEGEDASKSAYTERLDGLKKVGDPITHRWKEQTLLLRPTISQLRETLDLYLSQASAAPVPAGQPAGPHDHIPESEKQKVIEKVASTRQWLDDLAARQSERAKTEDPILTSEEVGKKRDDVIYYVTPILSKPKPKILPTKAEGTPGQTPKAEEGGKGATPEPGAQPKTEGAEADGAAHGPSEMDVD